MRPLAMEKCKHEWVIPRFGAEDERECRRCGTLAEEVTRAEEARTSGNDVPTEAMIEAGIAAFNETETLSVRRLLEVAYPAMCAADTRTGVRVTQQMVHDAMIAVPYNEYSTDEPYFAALAEHISQSMPSSTREV